MSISTSIRFERGAESVTLPVPAPGYAMATERMQVIGRTASGVTYVYDRDVTRREVTLDLACTQAQRDALEEFFSDTLQGAVNTFTYYDHLGHAYTDCRLTVTRLEWTKTAGGLYRIRLTFETGATVS